MAKAPPTTSYALLNQITDPRVREVLKLIYDKVGGVEQQAAGIGTLTEPLADHLDAASHRLTALADPTAPADAVTLQYLRRYVQAAVALNTTQHPIPAAPSSAPFTLPPVPTSYTCYTDLLLGQPAGIPAAPNLRWFRGDFCGVEVPGLPPVPGGAVSPSTLLTPFIDRYSPADQALAITAYKARGYTHWKLWWPDSREAGGVTGAGQTEDQFVATCQLLLANGLYPVTFLYSKAFDPVNPTPTSCDSLIAKLQAGGVAQILCVGGELDLFNTPGATLQALIDHIAGLVVPATHLYVHFSPGYVAWQAPGDLGSAFWIANMGKLTGILHQKPPDWDCGFYQAKLADLQVRFGNGVSGWPTDSGLGHPFDIVADEYSGTDRLNGALTEAQAQLQGRQAICSPDQGGGPAPIPIMGFNNGGPHV